MDQETYSANIAKVKQIIDDLSQGSIPIEKMNESIKQALSILKDCKTRLSEISENSSKIIDKIREENEKNITFAP